MNRDDDNSYYSDPFVELEALVTMAVVFALSGAMMCGFLWLVYCK